MGKGFWSSQVSFGNEAGMSSFEVHPSEVSRLTQLWNKGKLEWRVRKSL